MTTLMTAAVTDFCDFWDLVLQRFGGGRNRLLLVVTDEDIVDIVKQADEIDSIENAHLKGRASMFVIDNSCSLETPHTCVVASRAGNRLKTLVPCKSLDQNTLHNYVVQAMQAFRQPLRGKGPAYAYLLAVNETRINRKITPYYRVDAWASVDRLVSSASYPAREDAERPDWSDWHRERRHVHLVFPRAAVTPFSNMSWASLDAEDFELLEAAPRFSEALKEVEGRPHLLAQYEAQQNSKAAAAKPTAPGPARRRRLKQASGPDHVKTIALTAIALLAVALIAFGIAMAAKSRYQT